MAFVGELAFRQPATKAKYLFKSSKLIQMLNSKSQAGTKVQQSDEVDVPTSSPNNAKPNVTGSFSQTN